MRLALATCRGRYLPAWRWASSEAASQHEEQLHAVLAAHCPSLTLSTVRQLVALEPGLASSSDAMQAAGARCAALAGVLPDFTQLYPHADVAVLLAGGPRLYERLVARGRPPGLLAPAPATLLRLTKELKSDFGPTVGDLRAPGGDEVAPPPLSLRRDAVDVEEDDDDGEWGVVDEARGRSRRPTRRGAKAGALTRRRRGAADDE